MTQCLQLTILYCSVQSLSCVWLFATPLISARQASLSITNCQSSPKLMSIESVMPSSYRILCRPFSFCPHSLPASESFPTSQLFAWGGQSIGVSALASVLLMNTDLLYDGLVGSPCSPRDSQESSPTSQFKSINSWLSAFFVVQLSHAYMTSGKTIVLTRWTFVGKIMSLL